MTCFGSGPSMNADSEGLRPVIVIFCLTILTMLAGAAHGQAPFEDVARQAESARRAGQLARAALLYEQGLNLKPDWTEGWWSLGTVRYDMGEYGKAREVFSRLLDTRPELGLAWGFLGLTEYELRSYRQALEHLERADRLGIGDNKDLIFLTSYREATLLNRFERFDDAYRLLLLLAGDESDNPSIIEALGICLLRLPRLPAELDRDQQQAVRLAGQGAVYNWLGRWEDAHKEYKELIRRYPSFPNVHYAYGVFLLKSDGQAAIEQFQEELRISPNHAASILQLAYELLKQRKPKAALPYIEHALELLPQSPSATAALGKAYLQLGDYEKARITLEEAVKLAPDSAELHSILTTVCFRLGRKEEAQRHQEAVKRLRAKQEAEDPTLRELRAKTGAAVPPR